jgi:hypothetical protein
MKREKSGEVDEGKNQMKLKTKRRLWAWGQARVILCHSAILTLETSV